MVSRGELGGQLVEKPPWYWCLQVVVRVMNSDGGLAVLGCLTGVNPRFI